MWYCKCFTIIKPSSWHHLLAHPSVEVFNKLVHSSLLKCDKFSSQIVCSSCFISKSNKLPFKHKHTPRDTSFALRYIELWTSLVIGARYFLLIFYYSNYFMLILFPKTVDEVQTTLTSFMQMVEKNVSTKVKAIQSDDGKDFSFVKKLGSLGYNIDSHIRTLLSRMKWLNLGIWEWLKER